MNLRVSGNMIWIIGLVVNLITLTDTSGTTSGDVVVSTVTLDVETTGSLSSKNTTAEIIATPIYQKPAQNELKQIYATLEYAQDMYILPIVCSIGIVGNSLVASYLYEKRGTNSSFIYMFALLLADTLSLVSDLFLPISTLLAMSKSDTIRQTAANLYFWNKNFITYVLRGTAFNILCVLSLERLMAIKYPLKLKTSMTVKRPQIFLFFSFLISVCTNLQVPLFTEIAGITDEEKNETVFKRVYSQLYFVDKAQSDKIVLFLHFFAGPVQIVFFCVVNVLIVHGIYLNRRNLLAMNMNNVDRLRTIKNLQVKLCKIFLALCITNIFAFLPNSITTIIAKLFPELGMSVRDYSTQLLLHGGNLLRILNSMSDFIVMLAMSVEIRRDVRKKCRCIKISEKYFKNEASSSNVQSMDTKADLVSESNVKSLEHTKE